MYLPFVYILCIFLNVKQSFHCDTFIYLCYKNQVYNQASCPFSHRIKS